MLIDTIKQVLDGEGIDGKDGNVTHPPVYDSDSKEAVEHLKWIGSKSYRAEYDEEIHSTTVVSLVHKHICECDGCVIKEVLEVQGPMFFHTLMGGKNKLGVWAEVPEEYRKVIEDDGIRLPVMVSEYKGTYCTDATRKKALDTQVVRCRKELTEEELEARDKHGINTRPQRKKEEGRRKEGKEKVKRVNGKVIVPVSLDDL